MKKICFFMATPFTLGGEQRVISNISSMLSNEGYDVTILCTDMRIPRDNSIYNLDEKVKIDYLDGYNNKIVIKIREKREKLKLENALTGKYKNNLFVLKQINCDTLTKFLLKRKIEKEKYDVVIGVGIYNLMLSRVSKSISAKTIGSQHSSSIRYFEFKGEWYYNQEKYVKYMFNNLDEYVVLTNKDKEYIKEKFNKDVKVINNPKSIISNEVTNLKNKTFLAVGRFVTVKNFLSLIDMFNEFHKYNKDWKLNIVGAGGLKEEYIKKIKEYKLEKYIKIMDSTSEIEKYYLNSSIYLMSSIQEGWGMVIGEAIEFGLPVISFDITSAPEMIKDGYNGFIIENYNEQKYVEKMLYLANNSEKLKEFSKNSKIFSDSKSNDLITKKWINIFEEKYNAIEENYNFDKLKINFRKLRKVIKEYLF